MPTIVKLTGTSGSGKSTIAHWLLANYPHIPLGTRPTTRKVGRDEDYLITLPNGQGLILLGHYGNQCGGCDGIQPFNRIVEKLAEYTARYPKHHIFMEGLLISSYGSVGRFFDTLPKRWQVVYATMDTPLELCLERINQRRAKKGKFDPVNPRNTELKYKSTHGFFGTMQRRGYDCRWVDHARPVKSLLSMFGVELRKEPRHGK